MGRRRRKGDGLHSKVFPTDFKTDKRGKFYWLCTALDNLTVDIHGTSYAPTCTYGVHPGLVDNLSVCNTRHCGMLRLIKPKQYRPQSDCNSLYKVYVKKDKNYVNRSR